MEEYLETEPPRSVHASPVTMLGACTTEPQPNTPAQSNLQLSPFVALSLSTPHSHPALHPFFNQFPSTSRTPDPSTSRQLTPLVSPRVLLRPPSGTTRHPSSQNILEIPNTQQTRAATLANSKTNLTPKNPGAHHGPSQTVLSALPCEAAHPLTTPATAFPAISQDLGAAGRPQTPVSRSSTV